MNKEKFSDYHLGGRVFGVWLAAAVAGEGSLYTGSMVPGIVAIAAIGAANAAVEAYRLRKFEGSMGVHEKS